MYVRYTDTAAEEAQELCWIPPPPPAPAPNALLTWDKKYDSIVATKNISWFITAVKWSFLNKHQVVKHWRRHSQRHNAFSYIHGSVHRDSILIRANEMQQYAGVYLLQNYSACFGCLSHPSSGVHQTVTIASGTGHITFQSNNRPPA